MKDTPDPVTAPPADTAEVWLHCAAGRVVDVALGTGARARATAVLGRSAPGAAPALARRLFPVCGLAHAAALGRALAMARSTEADDDTRAARQVLAEAAAAHVWRVCIDWPAALGLPPRPAPVRRARAALAEVTGGDADGGGAALAALLDDQNLFGDGPESHAAQLVAALGPLADLALDPPAPEPGGSGALFAADARFDPLPVPQDARLTDRIAAILARARATRAALTGAAPVPPIAAHPFPGGALAVAQTARGPLAYRVTLGAGRIDRLHLVAPTDLVLAQGGALRRGLAQIAGGDIGVIARRARALVAAFDPCGEIRLSLVEAADA